MIDPDPVKWNESGWCYLGIFHLVHGVGCLVLILLQVPRPHIVHPVYLPHHPFTHLYLKGKCHEMNIRVFLEYSHRKVYIKFLWVPFPQIRGPVGFFTLIAMHIIVCGSRSVINCTDPNTSINKQKNKKNRNFYYFQYFVTSFWLFIFKNWCTCTFKKYRT